MGGLDPLRSEDDHTIRVRPRPRPRGRRSRSLLYVVQGRCLCKLFSAVLRLHSYATVTPWTCGLDLHVLEADLEVGNRGRVL